MTARSVDDLGKMAESAVQQARLTRESLRDLTSLLALPAAWAGRGRETVVALTCSAVSQLGRLRVCRVTLPTGQQSAWHAWWLDGKEIPSGQEAAWTRTFDAWDTMAPGAAGVLSCLTPLGTLFTLRLDLGFVGRGGSFWFAAEAPSFPTAPQQALLRAAVSLAGTGLENARLLEELAAANRAKDEFLAMLGHELRNPLAPIATTLEALKRRHAGPALREHQVIERQLRHLRRLVDDLLDVSRILKGQVQLHCEAVKLQQVLSDALASAEPLIRERGHALTTELGDPAVEVWGDPTRLAQVFANLLHNAAKFTPPMGKIVLQAVVQDTQVMVRVQDDGPGIDDGLKPKLFTLFEQGPRAIDRAAGGLGVGLALVQAFVQRHGGEVRLCDGGGPGATFVVTLPLHIAKRTPFHEPLTVHRSASKPRVLLVDDNEDALISLQHLLELCGYPVAIASSPYGALALAPEFQPSVAVLDIGLPDMDGYALAGALRQALAPQKVRLIALTGYGQPTDRERALSAGFELHMVKPADVEALLQAIDAQ